MKHTYSACTRVSGKEKAILAFRLLSFVVALLLILTSSVSSNAAPLTSAEKEERYQAAIQSYL